MTSKFYVPSEKIKTLENEIIELKTRLHKKEEELSELNNELEANDQRNQSFNNKEKNIPSPETIDEKKKNSEQNVTSENNYCNKWEHLNFVDKENELNEVIRSLENSLSEKEEEILKHSSLISKYDALKKDNIEQKTQIKNLKHEKDSLVTKYDTLKYKNTTLHDNVYDQLNKVNSLEKTISDQKKQIEANNTNISDLKDEISKQKERLYKQMTNLQSFKTKSETYERDYKTEKEKCKILNEDKISLEKENKRIQTLNEQNCKKIKNAETTLRQKERELNQNAIRINKLENELSTDKTKFNIMLHEVSTGATKNIDILNERISKLTSELKVNPLNSTKMEEYYKEEINKQKETRKTEVKRLEDINRELDRDIKTKLLEIRKMEENFSHEIEQLKAKNNSLTTEIAAAKEKIITLENEYN